ncbi:leucine-rich repeat-containing protein 68 [Lasius niger]|uniref:Leucine-rich repeat-containing protein 68 n=1 Tax=Lasius niger TaxID=67767 RepID=A0A0J7L7N4_LASNI|nr:leucine-rich repeat-containing protein 68 [Lasius niger]
MSEGADSVTQTCGDTTLTTTITASERRDATTGTATPSPLPLPLPLPPPPPQPTTTTTYTGRRPRFGTGGLPSSPYVWIDGRQLRSALSWTNKWPTRPPGAVPLRVSFPANDNHLVTGYLEPANPWRHAENVNREDLIFSYKESCARHNTEPLLNVLVQLKSSVILFDMLEYYESAKHLNISFNPEIGARGWQACSHMIKKTQCLEQLEARDITFNEQNMNILSRALRLVCHLHVLKLENCGLSGRAVVILVTALKMNSGIRELYLADNGLDLYDAIQLGSLLRMNNHLQLLDISNNNVQDDGVRDILEGLINQVNEDKTGRGLSILILWNNRLTKNSSPYFSRIIALSKTLETLNIGQNMLTDETLRIVNESLKQNRVLLQLGMQSTELTCEGIITLAEIMETNQVLQRIDLRDNSIQMRGMGALANVMKMNKTVTQIDLDDKPRIRIDGPLHEYVKLIAEIRGRCGQNEEEHRLLEESTEDAESPQHPSRLLNASSRKISLTCQTLPSPSSGRSATSLAADEPATRATLEPAKRTSGGRLRSPAPSPIPSPVASPIPSPSRNRFVVCRVPEASLRSTDSSASTSPVTPPSLGSSPNFFPSASSPGGPSRFRVSVVESTGAGRSSPKSVVASTSGSSITIGFNVRIDAADSDDADSVFDKTDASDNTAASASETKTPSSEQQVKERLEIDEIVTAIPEDECKKMTEIKEEEHVVGDKASNAIELSLDNTSELNRATSEELSTCMPRSSASTTWTGTSSTRTTELHSREQPSTSVQKHKSSLERLLSLFQHPGQFFSDSSSAAVDTRSSLQENVSGVMALGDRLQQYLKEGRTKIDGSSEHGSPLKNKSMGLNISQLQNLTGIFASFKVESQPSLVEHGAKFFGQMKNQDTNIRETDLEESVETEDEVIKNGENNLFDQKQNHSTKDDEKDLVAKEKSQIIGRDENLFGQENSQIPRNDEQKLFDQISRDDEKDFKIERNLEDREKGREIVRNVGENFQGSEDTQGRDVVAYDDSEDERLRNDIARNDGKNSASVRDGARDVNEKEDARSADDLRTESDRISDRLLPESVQSKDDFADNLVLGGVRVATNAAAISSSSSSPASESTACINDFIGEEERDDLPQDSKRNNDAKCLQRDDDAVEETNAAMIRTSYDSKEAVDSVSIASITTDDDVDVISNTCRDRRCDFTKRREGEDLHDDACRDSVDRATSTSVNINLDPHGESETTSPDGSQEAPGRRLFMPNNVDEHRIILETAANTPSHPEDDDEDERSKRMVDPTILVIPSPHETSLDKSDVEELIFCMTDVSTDGTSIEDELSPQGVAPRSSPNKLAESNSQDSGIEETALTIDETGMAEMPMESATAGISTLEIVATPKRSARDDNDDDDDDDEEEFGEFASDFLARETRLVDSDSTSGDGDGGGGGGGGVPYLKCAIADEGVARSPAPPMIAHSPAAVHGTR